MALHNRIVAVPCAARFYCCLATVLPPKPTCWVSTGASCPYRLGQPTLQAKQFRLGKARHFPAAFGVLVSAGLLFGRALLAHNRQLRPLEQTAAAVMPAGKMVKYGPSSIEYRSGAESSGGMCGERTGREVVKVLSPH